MQERQLLHQRAKGVSYRTIAIQLHRSLLACRLRYFRLASARTPDLNTPDVSHPISTSLPGMVPSINPQEDIDLKLLSSIYSNLAGEFWSKIADRYKKHTMQEVPHDVLEIATFSYVCREAQRRRKMRGIKERSSIAFIVN